MNFMRIICLMCGLMTQTAYTLVVEFAHFFNKSTEQNVYFFLTVYDPTEVGGSTDQRDLPFKWEEEGWTVKIGGDKVEPFGSLASREQEPDPYRAFADHSSVKSSLVKMADSLKQGLGIINFIKSLPGESKKIIFEESTYEFFKESTEKNERNYYPLIAKPEDLQYSVLSLKKKAKIPEESLRFFVAYGAQKPEDRENPLPIIDFLYQDMNIARIMANKDFRDSFESLMNVEINLQEFPQALKDFVRKVHQDMQLFMRTGVEFMKINSLKDFNRLGLWFAQLKNTKLFFSLIEASIVSAILKSSEQNIVVIMDQYHFSAIKPLMKDMGYAQVKSVGIDRDTLRRIRERIATQGEEVYNYWHKALGEAPAKFKKQLTYSYKQLLKLYKQEIKFPFGEIREKDKKEKAADIEREKGQPAAKEPKKSMWSRIRSRV